MAPQSRAKIVDAIESVSSEDWLAFLGKQRWFAAKGASPTSARITGIVAMPWAATSTRSRDCRLASVVRWRRIEVPLALTDAPAVPDQAIVRRGDDGTALVDAVHDEGFERA